MISFDTKSGAEHRAELQRIRDECDDRLAELQKLLDKATYDLKHIKKDNTRLEYLIEYVLDYFLNERKLKISNRDMDLFYLKEILDKYHKERDNE